MGGVAAVRGKRGDKTHESRWLRGEGQPGKIESSDAFTGQIAFGHETQARSAAAFFRLPRESL
jgi:hypothetical protein